MTVVMLVLPAADILEDSEKIIQICSSGSMQSDFEISEVTAQ